MPPDAKVLVAVPTMGSIHPYLVNRLLTWARTYPRISFYFTFRVTPVDRARNDIVAFFLKQPSFTHLLMIDSDTIPPPDALDRLLAHDKDVVTALTPIISVDRKTGDWVVYDNAFHSREKNDKGQVVKTNIAQRNTGLQKVVRCGAACILIKREVFEKLSKPFFQFTFNEDGSSVKVSEDIGFCDKLTDAGIEIYADTEVACQHEKLVMV